MEFSKTEFKTPSSISSVNEVEFWFIKQLFHIMHNGLHLG